MPTTVIYSAQRTSYRNEVQVISWDDQTPQPKVEPLPPHPDHATPLLPASFNWGYHGAGPSLLALSLVNHALQDPDSATQLAYAFKVEVVAKLSGDSWQLSQTFVREWAQRQIRQDVATARPAAIAAAA